MGLFAEGLNLPEITPVNEAWFTSGQISVQRCTGCRTRQHPPEEVCHSCGREAFDVEVLAPRGTVYSHTVVHHAATPALTDAVPYTVVLVALDDDPSVRVVGNFDGPPGSVRIGLPVEAYWEEHRTATHRILLPQWRSL